MGLDEYEEENVQKAVWLAQHLQKHGLSAVRFMRTAERWAQREGDDVVADAVDDSLDRM